MRRINDNQIRSETLRLAVDQEGFYILSNRVGVGGYIVTKIEGRAGGRFDGDHTLEIWRERRREQHDTGIQIESKPSTAIFGGKLNQGLCQVAIGLEERARADPVFTRLGSIRDKRCAKYQGRLFACRAGGMLPIQETEGSQGSDLRYRASQSR